MRRLAVAFAVLAVAGCATTQKVAASKPPPPMAFCNPCTHPCVSPDACGAPKLAAVPKPAAPAAFDPAPGTYQNGQTVTLWTATPGAVIHYTTDGTTPTATSPVYTAPIPVDSTTTVQASAIAPGAPASPVSSASYEIVPPPAPAPAALVVVGEKKLELADKVYFQTGKTTIRTVSYGLLDEVASVINGHPEVKKIAIEGHTDSVGKASFNTKLSQGRAEAVRKYLVEKGVEPSRLSAKGYGESQPIADNKTPRGREQNRRVEFKIAE